MPARCLNDYRRACPYGAQLESLCTADKETLMLIWRFWRADIDAIADIFVAFLRFYASSAACTFSRLFDSQAFARARARAPFMSAD